MNALERGAVDEGLFAAGMVLQLTELTRQITGLEREIEELKARLQVLEGSECP